MIGVCVWGGGGDRCVCVGACLRRASVSPSVSVYIYVYLSVCACVCVRVDVSVLLVADDVV